MGASRTPASQRDRFSIALAAGGRWSFLLMPGADVQQSGITFMSGAPMQIICTLYGCDSMHGSNIPEVRVRAHILAGPTPRVPVHLPAQLSPRRWKGCLPTPQLGRSSCVAHCPMHCRSVLLATIISTRLCTRCRASRKVLGQSSSTLLHARQ